MPLMSKTTGLDMSDPRWMLAGRFTLLDRLGTGTTGTVWRGRDEYLSAACAVKLLRRELIEDEGALDRLRAAIAWVGRLRHPGIVAVDELVTQDGRVALISRLVPGESLRALLAQEGRLPTGAALLLTAQLCDALAAAREVGVAHGDVKPSNLLLEPDRAAQPVLRLTDFGMAALLGRAMMHQTTGPQPKIQYVAPEIGAGESPTDASDIYAVGVVLHEALTGRPPIDGGPAGRQSRRGGSVLATLPAGLPDSVKDSIAACLHEIPRARPSAAGLAATLRGAATMMQADTEWLGVTLPDLRLTFPGDRTVPARPDQAVAAAEERGAVLAVRRGSQIAPRHARPEPASRHAGRARPWVIATAAFCGIALAAIGAFALTMHTVPQTGASVLPARAAVLGPGTASAFQSPTVTPTGSSSASVTATPSSSPTAAAFAPMPSASAAGSRSPSASPRALPSLTPSVSPSASLSPSRSAAWAGHTGRLLNTGSGKCLDTSGGYFANGVVEEIWTCGSGVGQMFTLTATGQLTVDNGAYCLDDAASGNATGTKARLWSCDGQPHQQWSTRSDGSIVGAFSGLCLDVTSPDDGTQIDFEPCDGRPYQLWSWD